MELKEYVGNQIKSFRKSKKMTQSELAKLLDTTKQTISRYEKGERKANQDMLFKLCDIFSVTIDDFFPQKQQEVPSPTPKVLHLDCELKEPRHSEWISNGEELLKKQTAEQNTVGNNVVQFPTKDDFESLIVHGLESAGDGIWQEDETDIEVRIPKSKIPEVFDDLALVIGDSMRPKLHNGDILFVTFTKQIEIGQIGVFRTSKGNFVKKLQPDRLESLNPDYEDIYFEEDEFAEAIGVVQDVYRK